MSFWLISGGMTLVAIFLMIVVGNAVYNWTKNSVWSVLAADAVAVLYAICLCCFASWQIRQDTARFLRYVERSQHRRQEGQTKCRAVERSGAVGRCRCMED